MAPFPHNLIIILFIHCRLSISDEFFKLSGSTIGFDDANIECNDHKPRGQLASIQDEIELNIASNLCQNGETTATEISCWIGLSRRDGTDYKWIDNTPINFGFINDNPSKPNKDHFPWFDNESNLSYPDDECIAINNNHRWFVERNGCNYNQKAIICRTCGNKMEYCCNDSDKCNSDDLICSDNQCVAKQCNLGTNCRETNDCCNYDGFDENVMNIKCKIRKNRDVGICCIKRDYIGCTLDSDCCSMRTICNENGICTLKENKKDTETEKEATNSMTDKAFKNDENRLSALEMINNLDPWIKYTTFGILSTCLLLINISCYICIVHNNRNKKDIQILSEINEMNEDHDQLEMINFD